MSYDMIILDPGHGMSNRRAGRYDPGVVSPDGKHAEATIAMDWANELRGILRERGKAVVRTRIDDKDPAPVGKRAAIARLYDGDIMLSIHVNSTPGVSGTETFYRGESNKDLATRLNLAVVKAMGTKNRGAKTEGQSQHTRLAVMSFQPCFLIELGFIENAGDLAKMLDPAIRRRACEAIADILR